MAPELSRCGFSPQLDSWSVILNGSVEVTHPEGRAEILCMGNSFGVSPTMEKEYMKGVMKTKVDDCQVGGASTSFPTSPIESPLK